MMTTTTTKHFTDGVIAV